MVNISRQQKNNLRNHFRTNHSSADTTVFADDQAVIARTEYYLQWAFHTLNTNLKKPTFKIYTVKKQQ